MLQDVPRAYIMMFIMIFIIILSMIWYSGTFSRSKDSLDLNDLMLSHATSEMDQMSRLYPGTLVLQGTYESSLWTHIENTFGDSGQVVFEYVFDDEYDLSGFDYSTERSQMDTVPSGVVESPVYTINGSGPSVNQSDHMTKKPIRAIRIKLKQATDGVGDWTYTSTIEVDASSRE